MNKLYLQGFLDFANVRIFPKTRLAPWFRTKLRSGSPFIFPDSRPPRRIEKSHIWYSTCAPELRVLDSCITCMYFHVITVTTDEP